MRPRRDVPQDGVRRNEQIRAREVRVIGPEGEQIGILPCSDAIAMAHEAGYDLVIDTAHAARTAEQEHEKNYRTLRHRAVAALVLAVPLLVVGMGFMHRAWAAGVTWVLATPLVFLFGRGFYAGAWRQLKHRSANMDTLVALSTGIAYLFSLFNLLFPEFWRSRGIEPHVSFEASGVVVAFVLLGRLL